ncbi:MAG: glycoside hydrolase family 28 protein, partial [Athalassotoga sp.]
MLVIKKDILSTIKQPIFSNNDFSIVQFGGIGNGVTDCSQAFSKAIKACNLSGGGNVIVPAGKFLTGPIHL